MFECWGGLRIMFQKKISVESNVFYCAEGPRQAREWRKRRGRGEAASNPWTDPKTRLIERERPFRHLRWGYAILLNLNFFF